MDHIGMSQSEFHRKCLIFFLWLSFSFNQNKVTARCKYVPGSKRIFLFPRFVITNNIFNGFLVMKYKWCVTLMSALEGRKFKRTSVCIQVSEEQQTLRLWSWTSGFQPLQGHEGSFKAFLDLIGHFANRLCWDGWERVDTGMQCLTGVVTLLCSRNVLWKNYLANAFDNS